MKNKVFEHLIKPYFCFPTLVTRYRSLCFNFIYLIYKTHHNHEVVKHESKISEANNPRCSLRNRGKTMAKPHPNHEVVKLE